MLNTLYIILCTERCMQLMKDSDIFALEIDTQQIYLESEVDFQLGVCRIQSNNDDFIERFPFCSHKCIRSSLLFMFKR